MSEAALAELLEMIRGEGTFEFIGKGVTSYPLADDENNQRIHSMCLELQKQKLIYPHYWDDKAVLWMPALVEAVG